MPTCMFHMVGVHLCDVIGLLPPYNEGQILAPSPLGSWPGSASWRVNCYAAAVRAAVQHCAQQLPAVKF
jgi:hypothetical protein